MICLIEQFGHIEDDTASIKSCSLQTPNSHAMITIKQTAKRNSSQLNSRSTYTKQEEADTK